MYKYVFDSNPQEEAEHDFHTFETLQLYLPTDDNQSKVTKAD